MKPTMRIINESSRASALSFQFYLFALLGCIAFFFFFFFFFKVALFMTAVMPTMTVLQSAHLCDATMHSPDEFVSEL